MYQREFIDNIMYKFTLKLSCRDKHFNNSYMLYKYKIDSLTFQYNFPSSPKLRKFYLFLCIFSKQRKLLNG